MSTTGPMYSVCIESNLDEEVTRLRQVTYINLYVTIVITAIIEIKHITHLNS